MPLEQTNENESRNTDAFTIQWAGLIISILDTGELNIRAVLLDCRQPESDLVGILGAWLETVHWRNIAKTLAASTRTRTQALRAPSYIYDDGLSQAILCAHASCGPKRTE